MKQLTSIKTLILCFFLTFSLYSAKATFVNPVHSNWINEMTGGEESLVGGPVLILLNESNELKIKLIAYTTDKKAEAYDPLFIGYKFGDIEGEFPVTEMDLQVSEFGGYEAVFLVTLYFHDECSNGVRLFDLDVEFNLYTKIDGIPAPYDFEGNSDFFRPSQYENFNDSYAATKTIVCTSNHSGGALIGQAGQDIIMDSPELDVESNEEIENSNLTFDHKIQDFSLSPNPFTEEMLLKYRLDSSSDVRIIVSDINQQEVFHHKINKQQKGLQEYKIRLQNNIPAGIYFVSVYTSDTVKTTRVIRTNSN